MSLIQLIQVLFVKVIANKASWSLYSIAEMPSPFAILLSQQTIYCLVNPNFSQRTIKKLIAFTWTTFQISCLVYTNFNQTTSFFRLIETSFIFKKALAPA